MPEKPERRATDDGSTRIHDGKLQIYKDPPGEWVDVKHEYLPADVPPIAEL